MNDICNTSNLLSFILFADDTTVFFSDKDVNVLYDTMNNELYEVCNWFKYNKLSLNASKTNLMLLGTVTAYKTRNANVSRSIHLDGCQLTRITNTKFLGMTIDENLKWKPHIESVCKLCSRNLGVLNKVKHFLPKNSLYQLYCFFHFTILVIWNTFMGQCIDTIYDKSIQTSKKSIENNFK